MSWPRLHALPYQADASLYFDRIRHLDWPIWLDSGHPSRQMGRYDILAAEPVEQLALNIEDHAQLDNRLRESLQSAAYTPTNLPFYGGWIGYLSYALGGAWMMGQSRSQKKHLTQAARAGLYDWAIVIDHHHRITTLVSMGRTKNSRDRWNALCRDLERPPTTINLTEQQPANHFNASTSYSDYARQFDNIQHYIQAGDTYQVNLTQRFEAHVTENSWSLYQRLRQTNPAHYGAYLGFDDYQILSNSPEQFIHLQNGIVHTRPIKGTRPRGMTPQQDAQMRADLISSDKDRAENLMIVDLLRNDLGKVCQPGSISTPDLFTLESYATLHHLVSTIRGELAADKDAIDLLKACFPGGSITGAPKRRAMQIIEELEPVNREIYCGSIFRLGLEGNLDSNISIRTLLKRDEKLYYWSGGGIVADSTCQAEYRESLDKAAAYFTLIGYPQAKQKHSHQF